MDLQEFRTRYQNFFKAKPSNFLEENNKEIRVNNKKQLRKNTRSTALLKRRNITVMAPGESPIIETNQHSNKLDTMARYREWKIQKEKKLKEERAKKKPVFKSCIAANTGFPELSSKQTVIKKNPIYKRVTRSQKPVASPPLPLPGRKTKKVPLPENEPQPSNKRKFNTPHLQAKNFKFTELNKDKGSRNRLVRQFAIDDSTMESKKTPKIRQSKRKSARKSVLRLSSTSENEQHIEEINVIETLSASSSGQSTVYSISDNAAESSSDDVFGAPNSNATTTPENSHKPVAYVSPFVTTSRGKGNVRKENMERSIRGLPSFTEHNTPDEAINIQVQATGAAYFHTVLDKEIARLTLICETWEGYKEAGDIPDDARDMIDVAVGQANLLMTKKFKQFRDLINSCQSGDSIQVVMCDDLQGFWDMVFMQVTNLNIRFNRLQTMKENNWEEIKPEEIKVKVVKKRELRTRSKTASSSNIRAAIQAARKKTLQTKSQSSLNSSTVPNEESVFNGGFFVVRSPHKNTPKSKSSKKDRHNLLVSVLSTEANRKNNQTLTPGVSIMRASRIAKSIENSAFDVDDNRLPTPGRSILKKSKDRKSHLNLSKAVLFKNDENQSDCENDPDAYNVSDLICFDSPVQKVKTPQRKSTRLILNK